MTISTPIATHLLERAPLPRALAETLLIGFGVALLALAAQLRIPLPFSPVPLTGQTLAVLLIGASYGTWRGALTATCYLLLGAGGAPVFAGGAAGFAHFAGPTGGYLIGFLFASTLMGYLSGRGWSRRFSSAWPLFFLGHTVVFICGVSWLSQHIGWQAAFLNGYVPFVPGELVKTSIAATLQPWMQKTVEA